MDHGTSAGGSSPLPIVSSPEQSGTDDLVSICKDLGVPIAAHKMEGPGTTITFPGIELDTKVKTLRLPSDKVVSPATGARKVKGKAQLHKEWSSRSLGHTACQLCRAKFS